MTKLIIQIPCRNEEASLPTTLAALPRRLPGIAAIETLVIDDGSTDRTLAVAHAAGVDHIVQLPRNMGLAAAFVAGLKGALDAGADIIVNTDADNQYHAGDIGLLVAPILEGRAEIVVGARPIAGIAHFSPIKKRLQRWGSWAVRVVSGADIPDAPSGFRALSREAAMRLNVFDSYTYTLETIIQAGRQGIAMISVPVRVNPEMRPSRLVRSLSSYVRRSLGTMIRVFLIYQPLRTFFLLGCLALAPGLVLGVRYLILLALGTTRSHAPSLILCAILVVLAVLMWAVGLIGELLAVNRRLLEDIRFEQRRHRLELRPKREDAAA